MQQPFSIPPTSGGTIQEPPAPQVQRPSGGWRSVLSTIAILLAAPVLALLLTAFVFQSYEVEGRSMETTLQNSDRLIVWKVPRTLARVTKQEYVPERSDIIVFVKPGLRSIGNDQDKQLIKRVVGLPGERVVVRDGSIKVYNSEHPEGFNPDADQVFTPNIVTPTAGDIDVIVPEGEVFVCGDNRGDSLDSRAFGTVPAHDIVGKMTVRIFPINKFKSFI